MRKLKVRNTRMIFFRLMLPSVMLLIKVSWILWRVLFL
nr:MAG TPA: hypothetical protein [Microviridae sp.]